jgi:hypothetical protein
VSLRLIIIDESEQNVELLRQGLEECPEVTVLKMKPSELGKLEIDAEYMPFIYAAERWGLKPIFFESQIVTVSPKDPNLPRYVLTGVPVPKGTVHDPSSDIRILVSAIFDAVRIFNSRNQDQIRVIGIWPELMGADRVGWLEAARIIRSVVEENRTR